MDAELSRSGSSPRLDAHSYNKVGVIHQPYFMPWLGYFSKLCFCHVFVVLDRVHFTKRHFLDRTRIINMHGEVAWLSLPTGQNLAVPIADVRLRPPDAEWGVRLIRTIESSYATAVHFEAEWPFVRTLLESQLGHEEPFLLSLNLRVVCDFLRHVGVSPPEIIMASDVTEVEEATGRVLDICQKLGITDLVIGSGRSRAVHDFAELRSVGVRTHIQDYLTHHPVYSQARRRQHPFLGGLSIIDALFNAGASEVRHYLTAPSYAPVHLGQDAMNASEATHE